MPALRDLRTEFEQLVLPVLPALYRTARRLALRPEDANDFVQDTCLRAYRTFAHFQPGTNGKAWLFTILYSVCTNAWHREKGRQWDIPVHEIEERFAGPAGSGPRDEELALLRQFDASPHIDAALAGLPEPFRAAVLLVDVEELSYEEAAKALGCPVGTLRSRLFRARKQLFLALADQAVERGKLTHPSRENR